MIIFRIDIPPVKLSRMTYLALGGQALEYWRSEYWYGTPSTQYATGVWYESSQPIGRDLQTLSNVKQTLPQPSHNTQHTTHILLEKGAMANHNRSVICSFDN